MVCSVLILTYRYIRSFSVSQMIHTKNFSHVHLSISDLFSKTLHIVSEGLLVPKYPTCALFKKHFKLRVHSPWVQLSLTKKLGPKSYPVEQQNTDILNHAVQSHVLEHAEWGNESCTSFPVWEKKGKRNEMKVMERNEIGYSVLFSWLRRKDQKPDNWSKDWTALRPWDLTVSVC